MPSSLEKNLREYFDTHYIPWVEKLVNTPTVHTDKANIQTAIKYCKEIFAQLLPDYVWFQDKKGNLIGKPKVFETKQRQIIFSSHIDTVGADDDWSPPYKPFEAHVTEREIVGRGSSDDKGNVAAEMLIALLVSKKIISGLNIVFTVSFNEEQGGQSAKSIGEALGQIGEQGIPVLPNTILWVLENTISLRDEGTIAEINTGQRHSYGVRIEATLEQIREWLAHSPYDWNPTSISPLKKTSDGTWRTETQPGGHAATTTKDKNLLYEILTQKGDTPRLIRAGTPTMISVLPTDIEIQETSKDVVHQIVFDLRSEKPQEVLEKELNEAGLSHRFVKALITGYDAKAKLEADPLHQIFLNNQTDKLKIEYGPNPGSTDSGTILKACPPEFLSYILPIILGITTRSQRKRGRLSHGAWETLDLESAFDVFCFIVRSLQDLAKLAVEKS